MAVYVDDAHIPAEVQNGSRAHNSTLCHLTADTQEELHAFAAQLGLKRSYFQPGKSIGGRPSPFWHYDVTAGKRLQAVKLGAVEIASRDMPNIMRARDATPPVPAGKPSGEPRQAARHSWEKGDGQARKCRNCELVAVARPLAVGNRWLTTYRQGDRTIIAERVPACGSALPAGAAPEELRQLADTADYHAGKAWRAGDLARASRLLADARALDPSRSDLWSAHERRIQRSAPQPARSGKREWLGRFTGETVQCGTCDNDFIRSLGDSSATTCLGCETTDGLKSAGIRPDDPGLQRVQQWNRSVLGQDAHLDPHTKEVLQHALGPVQPVHDGSPSFLQLTEEKEATA
jgi:DNA-binding transcriptional regulator YdaS (Cro superfamily)